MGTAIIGNNIGRSSGGGADVSVIDSLSSTSRTDALSANQGKALNDKIKTLGDTVNDSITALESTVNSKADNETVESTKSEIENLKKSVESKADKSSLEGKQDKLTAGERINISEKGVITADKFTVGKEDVDEEIKASLNKADNAVQQEALGEYVTKTKAEETYQKKGDYALKTDLQNIEYSNIKNAPAQYDDTEVRNSINSLKEKQEEIDTVKETVENIEQSINGVEENINALIG